MGRVRLIGGFRFLGIALVTALCLLPLLWTLLASIGLQPVRLTLQGQATLANYGEVSIFEPAFVTEFLYTLAVAVTATLLTMVAAFPAAYRLARTRSAWVDGLMQALLVLAVSPVIAYGLPLAGLERIVGLYGTFPGLILGAPRPNCLLRSGCCVATSCECRPTWTRQLGWMEHRG